MIACLLSNFFLKKSAEADEWLARSLELLGVVYGDSFDRVVGNVKATGSDLFIWTAFVYGNVFYNRSLVNLIETELDVIATLIQMDTLPQVYIKKIVLFV